MPFNVVRWWNPVRAYDILRSKSGKQEVVSFSVETWLVYRRGAIVKSSNIVGWRKPATSSDQNLARRKSSHLGALLHCNSLHCYTVLHCTATLLHCNGLHCSALGLLLLVISGNLPEIRALLLHKIGWKLVMSMIRVMRVKTDMLITMKSRTGRVLWPTKLYFLALFLSSWPFSTLGKLWRGGREGADMWRVPYGSLARGQLRLSPLSTSIQLWNKIQNTKYKIQNTTKK